MVTLHEALEYHRRGWSVIPICRKKAAMKWKPYQTQRAKPSEIHGWFGSRHHDGIGVVFGPVSDNLGSRDFDTELAYERWATDRPDLASTLPTVQTARGKHVYFRADPEAIRRIRPTTGPLDALGAIECGDGELRAGGGCYSVLPPSRHPTSGTVYEWIIPLPDNLPTVDPVEGGLIDFEGVEGVYTESAVSAGEHREHKTLGGGSGGEGISFSVEDAIARTLPTGAGQRHRKVFEFARELKASPELASTPAESPILKLHFRQWFDQAVPHMTTKSFLESYVDFKEAWDKVRFHKGVEPVNLIFAEAVKTDPPKCAEPFADEPKVVLLIALCRELQHQQKRKPFYLDCRTAGRLLDVSHTTAYKWLKGIEDDEIIKTVRKGDRAKRKATEFKYLGDF